MKKIYVAGHEGMVGSSIVNILKKKKNIKLILKNKSEVDLTRQNEVEDFFDLEKPDEVYIAAAKVGGIKYNAAYPAEFIYQNLMIQTNIIQSAKNAKVKKLLFLGSSCIYPKFANQPMQEKDLLTGQLEPTNEAYAVAKIAGIKMCESYNRQYGLDFRCVMPTNLYGPGDKYHPDNSHVIPGMIHKFHNAKEKNIGSVTVWGTGNARREFLYVEDLALASVHVMKLNKDIYNKFLGKDSFLNIGLGEDISIKELAYKIKKIVGYKGTVNFDLTQPDGMPQKLLNVKKINRTGWKSKMNLNKGLKISYEDFIKQSLKHNYNKKNNQSAIKNSSKYKFPLVKSSWDSKEYGIFNKVIKSDNFTMSENVKKFESKFSEFIGAKYTVMVNSGSSANLLMVGSLFYRRKNKLKRGDEVIVPSVSWSTSYFPLQQYGLKLVFVDIDINTLNYDTKKLKKAISNKTRLILCVNLLGNSNNFDEIKKIINKKKIILIEDSCQAMGTTFNKKFTGTFGIIGTYSTFFSHHINTMEGGLLVTDDKEIYQILLSLRAHGWVRELPKKNFVMNKYGDSFKDSFSFALPGYNVRPLEFSAALGIEQIKKLPYVLEMRRKNAMIFQEIMQNHPDLMIQKEIGHSSWFGFSLIIKQGSKINRNQLLTKLNKLGFETRPISAGNFARNKVLKYFNYEIKGDLKNSDYLDKNGIVIGNNHADLTEAIKILKKI